MFTGLVEKTGEVTQIRDAGEGKRITVNAEKVFEDVKKGDSISVSGACLTVEEFENDKAMFFLAEETLEKTYFDRLEEREILNFERSLKPDDRMGGHFVQGHVDTTSKVLDVEELEEGWNFTFSKPCSLENYIVEKGFVTVEGISLTVTDVDSDSFAVTVIPETWKITNLSEKNEGDYVNVEADIMAKYAEKSAQ